MKKKILAIILSLAMILSLAACSNEVSQEDIQDMIAGQVLESEEPAIYNSEESDTSDYASDPTGPNGEPSDDSQSIDLDSVYSEVIIDEYYSNPYRFAETYAGEKIRLENVEVTGIYDLEIDFALGNQVFCDEYPSEDALMQVSIGATYTVIGTITDADSTYIYLTDCIYE